MKNFVMKKIICFCLVATALAGPTGLSPIPRLDGRIVGGTATSIDKYPYQVSLLNNGKHDCGASIISSNWVLTAAHCIHNDRNYAVRAGSSIRDSGGIVYIVKQIIVHPEYDEITNDKDIALVEITEQFDLGTIQRIIPLAEENYVVPPGTMSVVTGWGDTGPGIGYSDILQEVTVPIVSQESCRESYGSFVTDNMMCAGYSEGGRDSCQGDSGGPLVAGGRQIGIVSWGFGCAEPRNPGVYTRVSALRKWIKESSGV